MRRWQELPPRLQTEAVRPYYDALRSRGTSRVVKRLLDWVGALLLLILLSPVFLVLAILVKADSRGPVFYCQTRVTRYDRDFKIIKFRTMVQNAERLGAAVTRDRDPRVTRIGRFLRRVRLDELPQLINVLKGEMSFVGTRPEVRRYVDAYTPEMYATLLMPAGITSEASLMYKDEAELLKRAEDVDRVYTAEILPQKMAFNLNALKHFSLGSDLRTALKTLTHVLH